MVALVMGLMGIPAMAQQYQVDVYPASGSGDGAYDTEYSTPPGGAFCMDIYLTGAPTDTPGSGGAYLNWSGSTGLISYVGYTDNVPPWSAGPAVLDPDGPGTWWTKVANLGGANVSNPSGTILVSTVCFTCDAGGDAEIDLVLPGSPSYWPGWDADINTNTAHPTLTVHQVCACTTDTDCIPVDWCAGGSGSTCQDCACVGGSPAPCVDSNPCTLDPCDAGTETCGEKTCDESQLTGPTAACCTDAVCADNAICGAEIVLIKEDAYYQPPAPGEVATIKNKVCLENPAVLVGGIQFDICDTPDCLECIACELTERTVMFDCVTMELENGCCRVIMFCKNPGCAINPGKCDIVTVVQQTKNPYPEECTGCIDETFENIVASDYNGYELADSSTPGTLCPTVCGDVCPAGTDAACGDGAIDIYDIMCEVNLALQANCAVPFADAAYGTANACQRPRADVPTGTPGFDELLGEPIGCADPDGCVNILDIMVLIDAALNRQDCCSFYYLGLIY
jgi:hypothetical protein